MKIEYKNNRIRKLCEDGSLAVRTLRKEGALVLERRLNQLRVFKLMELLSHRIGGCHALTGNRRGQYAMSLIHPYRLIFTVRQTETALIVEIVDYH